MINSLEKLEIVKDRGESAQILGACRRRLRWRNAFGLIQEYCTIRELIGFLEAKKSPAKDGDFKWTAKTG